MNKICVYFALLFFASSISAQPIFDNEGALIRSDTSKKKIYLCFTGHEFFDGFDYVLAVLKKHKIHASFFLTGEFVRNHEDLVKTIGLDGHYIGAHSDQHLLYCDWLKRDSLLFSPNIIKEDISNNLKALNALGIYPDYFMPPFEWYNKKVVAIALQLNQKTINFSPGTKSNADYTTPEMLNYVRSDVILESIYNYESLNGMNGFHLLIHPGVSNERKDKLYFHLDSIINELDEKNYQFSKF